MHFLYKNIICRFLPGLTILPAQKMKILNKLPINEFIHILLFKLIYKKKEIIQ